MAPIAATDPTPAALAPAGPAPTVDTAAAGPAVTSQTVDGLASQTAGLAQAAAAGTTSQFQLILNPQGLGRVTVQVAILADGQLSAAFAFDKPQTAQALSARSAELQKALAESGFNVSDAGLSFSVATHAQAAATQAQAQTTAAPSAAASDGRTGLEQGPGFGQGSSQDGRQSFNDGSGQARGRAFAAGAEMAAAADLPTLSTYAARVTSGVDIRI